MLFNLSNLNNFQSIFIECHVHSTEETTKQTITHAWSLLLHINDKANDHQCMVPSITYKRQSKRSPMYGPSQIAQLRWPNVGPTLAQRRRYRWPNVDLRRWRNVILTVGPT